MTSLAELRERHKKMVDDQENKGGAKGPSDYASFAKGSNMVRFLPGVENPLEFYKEAHLHKYKDSEGNWKSYRCRKASGEECPVCEVYWDLWKRHKALDLGKDAQGRNNKSKYGNMATLIKGKPRYFALAVVRGLQEAGEDPVKYVAMSQQLFDRVMGTIVDEDYQLEKDPDNTTILSIEDGNDFDVKLTDQGEFVSFSESKAKVKKTRAGTPAEVAEWMETKLNLATLTTPGTYEEGREIVQMLEASLNTVVTDAESEAKKPVSAEVDDATFEKGLKT